MSQTRKKFKICTIIDGIKVILEKKKCQSHSNWRVCLYNCAYIGGERGGHCEGPWNTVKESRLYGDGCIIEIICSDPRI